MISVLPQKAGIHGAVQLVWKVPEADIFRFREFTAFRSWEEALKGGVSPNHREQEQPK